MLMPKNNKVAGRDYVVVEQLKNIGPKDHRWLLTMKKKCLMENNISTLWRQSKIMAIQKPGKNSKELPTNIPLVSCCCRPHQQPFIRTPADGIPPSNRNPDQLVDWWPPSIQPAGAPPPREPSTNP